ncbi:hypothetical protein MMC07_008444 [Pseudocyphellaria aurata]|nr:hypothetical protein [Pseudocyphellaria aurata]
MVAATFSALPAEIHVAIARYCSNNELINLCRTCKQTNERCLHVLYRHVDLQGDRYDEIFAPFRAERQVTNSYKRQHRFVRALLSHPEYGTYVRSFNGPLFKWSIHIPTGIRETMISENELWGALLLLTRVQSINVGAISLLTSGHFTSEFTLNIPSRLFQSATSVTLAGYMEYNLAKTILNAIDPAMLKHLGLDMVRDLTRGKTPHLTRERGQDGLFVADDATTGLLPILRGRCTSLRTVRLRTLGEIEVPHVPSWEAAEEARCVELASFIRSVQATVEEFTYEHDGRTRKTNTTLRAVDERFGRLVFPTIVSGIWPCLTSIELKGVRDSTIHGGTAEMTKQLKAALGVKICVIVREPGQFTEEEYM